MKADVAIDDSSTLLSDFPSGFDGLDELAEALGVGAKEGGMGIVLEGKSGSHYDLVELLQAHIGIMKECVHA